LENSAPDVLTGIAGEPGNGPYVILKIQVRDGIVESIEHETPGCPAAYNTCSALDFYCKGRQVENVIRLDADDLLRLQPLPEGKGHYASMAIQALQAALGGSANAC